MATGHHDESGGPLVAVSAVFDSFRRVLLCLDRHFTIMHASASLATLIADEQVVGLPVQEILGNELFGVGGVLRDVLEKGEMREGWRASIRANDGHGRLVSLSVAPFKRDPHGICDANVAYIIIIRPAEDDASIGTAAPTAFAAS